MTIYHFERAIFAFDHRGTTFHPIATVVIGDGAEFPDRRAVDVAAEDSIDREFLCVTYDLFLEPADKADRVFYSLLGVGAERPVTEAESAPHEIDEGIQREQKLVAHVACEREPLHVLHDGVELMPVNDEHSAAIGQAMNSMLLQGDVAIGAVEFGEHIVVIARDVNDAGAFARLAKDFLDDVVMLLWPVDSAPQLPDVDQIANDVERFELIFAEEMEQRAGIAATRAQMHVGNPRRAHMARSARFKPRRFERKSRRSQDRHFALEKISYLLFCGKPAEASRRAFLNLTSLCFVS
jgi:hypothetical protein